jgi:hypothetical protein
VLTFAPFMFSTMIVFEMTVAKPGGGYRTDAGQYVHCQALAMRGKSQNKPRCAYYGSKETNPRGYGIAVAALLGLGAVLWVSSRPGRGLSWSK